MTAIQQSRTGNCKGDVTEAKPIRVNLRSSAVCSLWFLFVSIGGYLVALKDRFEAPQEHRSILVLNVSLRPRTILLPSLVLARNR